MSTRINVAACLAFALSMNGCGPSEHDARAYIAEQGISVASIKKVGGSFEYTGTKGNEVCTGTVTIAKGFGSTSKSHYNQCQRDTSACKPGAAAACVQLADELYSQKAKVFPTTAAELYRTACADNDGHACARAGEFEAIGKVWHKVREYSKKGCDLGDGDACARLGFTELEGTGTEKDAAKALELMKKACEKSSLRGCRAAAGLLLDGKPADPAAALPFAEKVCTARYDDGCFVLGMALFDGKKDYQLALTHLDAACNDEKLDQRGFACNVAGIIIFDGLGMKKDPARGMTYLEKSCELSYPDGCSNAAKMYSKGQGVARDKAKADELAAKACKLGKQEACAN